MPSPEPHRDAAVTPAEIPRSSSASRGASTLSTRKARRYGFACSGCKSRKIKCSGHRPVCTGCQRSGEQCTWPNQTSTESRLREANARIRRYEASVSNPSPDSLRPPEPVHEPGSTYTSQRNATSVYSQGYSKDGNCPAASTDPDTEGSLWFQTGIGEDGAVVYNGPTSRFHAGSLEEDHAAESDPKRGQIETLQSQYALMDSVWLPLIVAKPSMSGTGVDVKGGMALLDIYWSWLHPLHGCVYRPILMMDLALGGPYCSDFLLLCIFGLAARHLPEEAPNISGVGKGDHFIARARELLLEEMTASKPAIPTIQGLLILGGRQCAMGMSSEGWLYTGMAIRMMKDIGLHLDITKLSRLERWTPAELETRKRLYNSAYIWDKTLSLALGRPPSLTRRPYPAHDILDKIDDERTWKPVHANEVSARFVESPSWTTSTFCAFCHLHEVTTDMMLLFSSVTKDDEFTSQIQELDDRLCQWYQNTPQALKVEDTSALEQSRPPHIVSLNLLYHTLHILLRRPYLNSSNKDLNERSIKACLEHSKEIHDLHSLHSQTFPYRLMTYQVSYCIYTAATVESEWLKRASTQQERGDAAARLAAAFSILQKEASHTPGSGRSLDTIRRLLSTGQPKPVIVSRGAMRDMTPTARNQIQQQGRHLPVSNIETSRDTQEETLGPGAPFNSSTAQPAAHSNPALTSAVVSDGADVNFFSPTNDGAVWNDYVGHGGTDTGAGFHPDAFPWGVHGLSSLSGPGMVWPPLANIETMQ